METHVEMQWRRDAAETGTNYRAKAVPKAARGPRVFHNLLLFFEIQ
jgi:hypothetical protein